MRSATRSSSAPRRTSRGSIAEVQDLGIRVTSSTSCADGELGNLRPLRQECDDIVEISAAHLRPSWTSCRGGARQRGRARQQHFQNGSYPRQNGAYGHGSGLGAMTRQRPSPRRTPRYPPGTDDYTGPASRGLPARPRAQPVLPEPAGSADRAGPADACPVRSASRGRTSGRYCLRRSSCRTRAVVGCPGWRTGRGPAGGAVAGSARRRCARRWARGGGQATGAAAGRHAAGVR